MWVGGNTTTDQLRKLQFEHEQPHTRRGIATKVGTRVSFLNGNHFYNQVLMRTFAPFPRIYIYPRLRHFKNEGGGHSADSPFEQNSMQRLTGVPSPYRGGTGWVGSDWDGNWRPQPINSLMPNRSEPLLSTSHPALQLTKNRSLYLVCNRLESKKPNRRGMG